MTKAKKRARPRTCRECGCTDRDCSGCIERTGRPCTWVLVDLCSACYERLVRPVSPDITTIKNVLEFAAAFACQKYEQACGPCCSAADLHWCAPCAAAVLLGRRRARMTENANHDRRLALVSAEIERTRKREQTKEARRGKR